LLLSAYTGIAAQSVIIIIIDNMSKVIFFISLPSFGLYFNLKKRLEASDSWSAASPAVYYDNNRSREFCFVVFFEKIRVAVITGRRSGRIWP
jgi:hypothetical protein